MCVSPKPVCFSSKAPSADVLLEHRAEAGGLCALRGWLRGCTEGCCILGTARALPRSWVLCTEPCRVFSLGIPISQRSAARPGCGGLVLRRVSCLWLGVRSRAGVLIPPCSSPGCCRAGQPRLQQGSVLGPRCWPADGLAAALLWHSGAC